MTITRITEFQAEQDKEDDLHEFLKSLIPYISSSIGCQSCQVLRSTEEQNAFVVIETWRSVEDHKLSIENYPQEKMQQAMSLIGAPPSGKFYSE